MSIFKKLWAFVAKIFNGLSAEAKKIVPIAINVINAIKTFEASPTMDFLEYVVTTAIPGNADDVLIAKARAIVKEWIPKVLLELNIVESIANITDQNERLIAIVNQFKLSSDETQNIVNHGLASLIIEKLSDGELSWSDSIAISEYYYKNILKK